MKRRYKFLILLLLFGLILTPQYVTAQSDRNLNESFLTAIYARDFSLMDKLLAKGVDINDPIRNDLTPLAEAAFAGDLEVVDYLLRKGAKVEGTKNLPNSPIYFAIFKGNIAVVGRFLDLGIPPNYTWPAREGIGGTLLTVAVDSGHLEIVELLVQRGADVNFLGSGNYGPLYRSIFSDYFEVFKFLLSKGACLNERDKKTLSEVEWKKNEKNKKFIQLLDKNQECKKK